MAQQKFKIKIDKKYNTLQRAAIASEVIDFIIERSQNGKDKKNRKFKGYSESYMKSLEFKLGGKGKKPNLTLSGEMLNSLTVLSSFKGEITIGIPKDDEFNNEKAEGNIKGTYGQKKPTGKARDFMGITKKDLKSITNNVKTSTQDTSREDLLKQLLATETSRRIAEELFNVDDNEL